MAQEDLFMNPCSQTHDFPSHVSYHGNTTRFVQAERSRTRSNMAIKVWQQCDEQRDISYSKQSFQKFKLGKTFWLMRVKLKNVIAKRCIQRGLDRSAACDGKKSQFCICQELDCKFAMQKLKTGPRVASLGLRSDRPASGRTLLLPVSRSSHAGENQPGSVVHFKTDLRY